MRHRQHTSVVAAVLLTAMTMGVPSTGWSKGDRSAQGPKQDVGVAR